MMNDNASTVNEERQIDKGVRMSGSLADTETQLMSDCRAIANLQHQLEMAIRLNIYKR
jgi:hypothetical protein